MVTPPPGDDLKPTWQNAIPDAIAKRDAIASAKPDATTNDSDDAKPDAIASAKPDAKPATDSIADALGNLYFFMADDAEPETMKRRATLITTTTGMESAARTIRPSRRCGCCTRHDRWLTL